jgi:hypothetical protein
MIAIAEFFDLRLLVRLNPPAVREKSSSSRVKDKIQIAQAGQ